MWERQGKRVFGWGGEKKKIVREGMRKRDNSGVWVIVSESRRYIEGERERERERERWKGQEDEWVRVDREGRIALIWSVLCSLVIDRYVYWGEYPLSFAACLGQEECYRLILARGADPNLQDFNGNTVLHLLIIYEKIVSNDSLLTSKITALQNVNFR